MICTTLWFSADLYNVLRPSLLQDQGLDCLKELDQRGISYQHLGETSEGVCGIKNAVRIKNFPKTQLSSSITVNCSFALDLNDFFTRIEARQITHMGAYNCREVRDSLLMSEHSYGTAIDISDIDSANILEDWGANTEKGKALKRANDSACSFFSNVLSPNTNAAHRDHFHLDNGFGSSCLF